MFLGTNATFATSQIANSHRPDPCWLTPASRGPDRPSYHPRANRPPNKTSSRGQTAKYIQGQAAPRTPLQGQSSNPTVPHGQHAKSSSQRLASRKLEHLPPQPAASGPGLIPEGQGRGARSPGVRGSEPRGQTAAASVGGHGLPPYVRGTRADQVGTWPTNVEKEGAEKRRSIGLPWSSTMEHDSSRRLPLRGPRAENGKLEHFEQDTKRNDGLSCVTPPWST